MGILSSDFIGISDYHLQGDSETNPEYVGATNNGPFASYLDLTNPIVINTIDSNFPGIPKTNCLRLAWIINLKVANQPSRTSYQVWVDTETGQVLGGYIGTTF